MNTDGNICGIHGSYYFDGTDDRCPSCQKDLALEYVASQLAIVAFEHIKAAKDIPGLKENTADVLAKFENVTETLGIGYRYQVSLGQLLS